MKPRDKILIAAGVLLAVLFIAAPQAIFAALIVYFVGSGIYTFFALRRYFSRDRGEEEAAGKSSAKASEGE